MLLGCGGAALLTARAASAQDASPPADSGGLEDIIVTATKRTERLQDVPVAVTAVSGDALVKMAISGQETLTQVTPAMTTTGQVNFVAPYIRGVGTTFALPGLESSVAIYLDDVYLSRASSGLFSFSDIERVEVLKGPQGVLYGRNSPAGAIKLVTKEPTSSLQAGASIATGNYGRLDGTAYVSGPITENLSGRISVNYNSRNGYVKRINSSLPKLNDKKEWFVLGKLNWAPTDRLTVKLSYDFADKNDFAQSGFVTLENTPLTDTAIALGGTPRGGYYDYGGEMPRTNRSRYHERDQGVSLRIIYEADDLTFTSITAFRKIELLGGIADVDTTDLPFFSFQQLQGTKDYTQEFQIASNGDGPFKWVAGVFAIKENAFVTGNVYGDGASGSPNALVGGFGSVRVESIAPFAQLSYAFTDQFELVLGGRYTLERKKLHDAGLFARAWDPIRERPADDIRTTLATFNDAKTNFKVFTPQAILNYRPMDNFLLYLSFSRGFKSGGYNLPAFSQPGPVGPEKLTSYEFGWKYQSGPVRLNGAAFYYDYKAIQVEFLGVGAVPTVNNGATARVKGAEAEFTYAPSSRLQIGIGGAIIDAKYKRFDDGPSYELNGGPNPSAGCLAARATPTPTDDVVACSGFYVIADDLSGRRLPFAPKYTGFVRVQYEIPLSAGAGGITANAVLSYRSRSYHDPANQRSERPLALLSGSLGWESDNGKFGLAVFGENLTDRKYATIKARQPTGGWHLPAPPRLIGVRASVKY